MCVDIRKNFAKCFFFFCNWSQVQKIIRKRETSTSRTLFRIWLQLEIQDNSTHTLCSKLIHPNKATSTFIYIFARNSFQTYGIRSSSNNLFYSRILYSLLTYIYNITHPFAFYVWNHHPFSYTNLSIKSWIVRILFYRKTCESIILEKG